LVPFRVVEPLHHEELAVDSVMRLIPQGASHRHPRVFKNRIPAYLLVLKPASYTLAIGGPSRGGDMLGKTASPLAQREHPQALALSRPIP
jgi:hypothetical protein